MHDHIAAVPDVITCKTGCQNGTENVGLTGFSELQWVNVFFVVVPMKDLSVIVFTTVEILIEKAYVNANLLASPMIAGFSISLQLFYATGGMKKACIKYKCTEY